MSKRSPSLYTAAALVLAAGAVATAQSVTTGFGPPGVTTSQVNPNGSIMFDVVATHPSGLLLTALDIHSRATAGMPITVQVYYKPGTHVGFHNNKGAWTLLSEQTVTAAGLWTPTPLSLTGTAAGGLVIPTGQTYAIYINIIDPEAAVVYYGVDDIPPDPIHSDIQLIGSNARALDGLFTGTGFNPRGLQGTVYFNNCGAVPCPTPPTGACCLYDTGDCIIATKADCAAVHNGFYQGDNTTCASACTFFSEVEPNSSKTEATPITLAHGEGIVGLSTGTTTTAGSTLDTTVDYYRIKTAAAPLGIYRHRMVLGNGTATSTSGNSTWIRAWGQTSATAGPWPGPVGTASTTENTGQTHQTEGLNRVNYWYGFGKQEEVFYRVAGTTTTTGSYRAILESTPVTPANLGTFQAGLFTIDTVAQNNTLDTSIRVFNGNLEPIFGCANDDASINGGHTANSSNTSFLRRELPAGTYYMGISIGPLSVNQGAPCDDNFRTYAVMDFPDVALNPSTLTTSDVSFRISNDGNSTNFPAARNGRGEIAWFTFTVTGTIVTGACCFADGTCTELTESQCLAQSGTYAGNNITCAAANCPQPGACCFEDGTCTFVQEAACLTAGGNFAGASITCAAANCPQPGACCVPSGCIIRSQAQCLAMSGTYAGNGVSCATANCPPPTVANIIGLNFTTAASTTPDPQNWNRISAAQGTLTNAMDDTGAATGVDVTYGGATPTTGFTFLSSSTLAPDAVPQHIYNLAGMTGYGYRSSAAPFSVVFSNLNPDVDYEYWFVAYRVTSAINQTVQVSDGDVLNAISFPQAITSTANNGRFLVNEVNANNTMLWDNLSQTTRSSSTGTLTFNWAANGTETTVVGAIAIRRILGTPCYANCDGSTTVPILNVADFGCFLSKFAAGDPYANCDGSTTEPILNVADFGCFLQKFAAGCE